MKVIFTILNICQIKIYINFPKEDDEKAPYLTELREKWKKNLCLF